MKSIIERIEAMDRLRPDAIGDMHIESDGPYLFRDTVLAVIREWEAEQAKQPEHDFADFGGFDPNRPWVNDWAKYRGVDFDGAEWESSHDLDMQEEGCWWMDYRPRDINQVRYELVRSHDMTGKNWTKSKQSRN